MFANFTLLLVCFSFVCHVAKGELVGVEPFSYANGGIAGSKGGQHFDWDNVAGSHTGTSSDWNNLFGGTTIANNALVTNGSGALREFNGPGEGRGSEGAPTDERLGSFRASGVLFYQFDMTRSSSAGWGGLSVYDFGSEEIFFGVPGNQAGSDTIGVEESGVGTTNGLIQLADNQTYNLVAVLDFDNNRIGLFIDPDDTDVWNSSGGTSDVSRVYTTGDWTSSVRLASAGQVTWDNLTVATLWSDLTIVDNDTDDDDMPDDWERDNGLIVGIDDSALDEDSDGGADGLTNLEEYQNGTDPQDSDSDNDGFNDGAEVAAETDPRNSGSYPGSNPDPDLIGRDSFDYDDGAIAGANGGAHWDFDNSTANDSFLGHTGPSAPWVATGGSPQVVGGVLVTQNSSAKRNYFGTDEASGAIGEAGQNDRRAVYYRFEMTRRAGATWGGASSFDFGTERYLFGVPNTANPATGNREFAIHDLDTNAHGYSGIQAVTDQTYTIVAKLDYDANLAALYLDPDLSQAEEFNTPVATYAHTSGYWSTGIRLGSGSGGDVEWDGVRVATTWDALEDGPPVTADDSVTMAYGKKARLQVLANDTGSLNPASLTITRAPSTGTATANPDGSILYQHTTGAPPDDSFEYEVSNASGTLTTGATVTVTFSKNYRFSTNFVDMPSSAPATALTVEDAFPGLTFSFPHGFSGVPGDGGKLFVAEGEGRIYLVPNLAAKPTNADKILVADLTGQVNHDNNEKAMKGIAAHPDWENNGYIYVTYNSSAGTVRVSRLTCLTSPPYTAGSEQILIDQADPSSFHNISSCRFGADGYLYVGIGDGDSGGQNDNENNSQHIDKNLWSCIMRLDVDKLPGNLEPNVDPDIPRDGSGKAYFSIPADNPFVGATSFNGVVVDPSEVRTEIYLTGMRNPWQFSPEDLDGNGSVDEVWVADVGSASREEIGVYTAGQNGGWAWREGTLAGARSGQVINGANEAAATLTEPLWDYTRGGGALQGNSVTGGFIYRGTSLPELTGKYVFADFISGNIWSLERTLPEPTVVRLAGEVGIVALTTDPASGDILFLDRGNTGGNPGVGSIKRLTLGTVDTTFPDRLSQTNFFADLSDLTPNPGGVFYQPNLRFWSDFAEKSRWFLLNDTTDTVSYSESNPWSFPQGMVWVKHFDYPTEWETFSRVIDGQAVTDRRPVDGSPSRRLETRFLVRTASGSYGVSYRWNNLNSGPQTEAALADNNGETFEVNITIDDSPSSIPWNIPSRSACLTCHTPEAGHALSFNTPQLNTEGIIADVPGNFVGLLDVAGYITGLDDDPAELPRHLRPDETTYSLEARVRSYLEVNCAYCHQAGGTGGGNWDGRAHLTLAETGLVNGIPVDGPLSPGDLLVVPGHPDASIIYNRTAAANGYSRMPPLATEVIDLEGAQLLAEWIAGEIQEETTYEEWRLARFGSSTSAEGEPGANPDGDQGDNQFEWFTNTDPKDRDSIWQPVFRKEGSSVAFDFTGLGNRSVTVLRSDDLTHWSAWPVDGNDGLPLNPDSVHTLTGPSDFEREFYRFEIKER
ncbi:PQQ-dependent sugar dehydrogenase [Haloferula sp.]|uniref:PQQ-dependent sugar dehydrogenase n=1 Tax=Haloferula sp. TaxID=2497595 RepID=UPI003C718790